MLMQALHIEGVELIFGYPGGAALHVYDALFRQQDIEHILVRHEQGATHAADGYARSTGKAGVVLLPLVQAQPMQLLELQLLLWIQFLWLFFHARLLVI